jgi:energy-coupling factor transporter transmembrane protein EcfT
MVFRLLPDIQVSPLGGVVMWLFLLLAGIGVLFAAGIGGALIWAGFWLIALVFVYLLLLNFLSWVF